MVYLDGGTLAAIIAGTAFGTVVLFLLCIVTLIYLRRCRHEVIGANKDRILKNTANRSNDGQCDKTRRAVYDISGRLDQERGIKFGQSTQNGAQHVDGVITILEREQSQKNCISNGSVGSKLPEGERAVPNESTKNNSGCNHYGSSLLELPANRKPDVIRVSFSRASSGELGFTLGGNSKDGLVVQSASERKQSANGSRISEGDRILAVRVTFEDVQPDTAMEFLRHASRFNFILDVEKHPSASSQSDALPDGSSLQRWVSFDDSSVSKQATKHAALGGTRSNGISPQVWYSSLEHVDKDGHRDEHALARSQHMDHCGSSQNVISEIVQNNVTQHGDSHAESKEMLGKITVTAEINAIPKPGSASSFDRLHSKAKSSETKDPYAGLTHEERMQIIRLSYEEPDFSRSTPNLSVSTVLITAPAENQANDNEKNGGMGNSLDMETQSNKLMNTASKIPVPTIQVTKRRASAQEGSDDTSISSSRGVKSAARLQTSAVKDGTVPSRHRESSLGTLTSNSSITASEDSGRVSSPDTARRDSAQGKEMEELETEEFAKLLYFQKQLEKQHEELVCLGVQVPGWKQGEDAAK